MSLGLLATPTVTICKVAKMVFNVAPGNFYLSQYLEYQEANGTSATVEALAGLAGGTDAAFVTTVLTNLGLADDAGASAFLTSAVAASGRGAALEAAISALDGVAADDATYGAAKTAFDTATVTSVTYSTNAANTATDSATLAAAISEDAVASGQSFTLTTSVNTFTGGDGNDTFNADNTGTNNTSSTADVLAGGNGNDTLNIFSDGTVDGIPNITSIETVRFYDKDDAIDVSTKTDVTTVELVRGDGGTTITVAAGTTVNLAEMELADAAAGAADITVAYKATDTSATLGLNGVTNDGDGNNDDDVTITGAALTDLTVNVTGAKADIYTLDAAATTAITINADVELVADGGISTTGTSGTMTVTGAGKVNVGTLDTGITTYDASASSGMQIVTAAAGGQTITTGSGNDRVSVAALNMTKNVDGGEGTDTIVFTASTNFASTKTKVLNFEVLRGSGNGSSYDFSAIDGLESIEMGSAGTTTFTNLGADTPVTIIDAVTTAAAFNLSSVSGDADVLNVTIDDDASTGAAITVGAITAAGVETLNLATADSLASTAYHTVSALTGSTSLKTLNVTGNSNLKITDATVMASGAVIDASNFDKKLEVGTNAAAGIGSGDTVRGGSADDLVGIAHGNLGTTTSFVGGAGDDTLYVHGNGSTIEDGDFAAISGVDNLVITSATGTTVTFGGYAQAAISTVDKNSDGRLDVTAASATTDVTINAGALISEGVDLSVTLTNVDAAGAQAIALTGGAIADTFTVTADDTADAGDDNITTSITGNDGIDVITYTATATDVADVLTIVSAETKVANADIVTGFVENDAGTVFDYNGTVQGTIATDVDTGATLAAAIAVAGTQSVYVVSTDVANSNANTQGSAFEAVLQSDATNLVTNYAALEAALLATDGDLNGTITGLDADLTASEAALLVMDNGTGSVVMRITNTTATGNTLTADEIDLVAVFTNADGLVAADFV